MAVIRTYSTFYPAEGEKIQELNSRFFVCFFFFFKYLRRVVFASSQAIKANERENIWVNGFFLAVVSSFFHNIETSH